MIGSITDDDSILHCPVCGDDYVHIEQAHISARLGEDGPFNEISVNHRGGITTMREAPGPAGSTIGTGRRQRISIIGYCEGGGHEFALVFTQHKGQTFVEHAEPTYPTTRPEVFES